MKAVNIKTLASKPRASLFASVLCLCVSPVFGQLARPTSPHGTDAGGQQIQRFGNTPPASQISTLSKPESKPPADKIAQSFSNQSDAQFFGDLKSKNALTNAATEADIAKLRKQLKDICPNCDVVPGGTPSGSPCPTPPKS